MARWGSDPEVKEWMKEHPTEVERLEKLYAGLSALGLEDLLTLAPEGAVARAREMLVVSILKVSPEKALEVVSGQGTLPE